jgi:endonuclease III
MKREDRARIISNELEKLYPEAFCKLQYQGVPERLVIATILSAQTTDDAVNRATPGLWKKYPDMNSLASADNEDVQRLLKTIGLFRNKTKSIIAAAAWIRDKGLPETIDELVQIPGVGRKTANVIVGEVFGKPSITVDTHVKRLAGRLDLSRNTNPDKIEKDLKKIIPEDEQTMFSHRLITHGRQICRARNPRCGICPLTEICTFYKKRGPE